MKKMLTCMLAAVVLVFTGCEYDENAAINILQEGLRILNRDTDGRSGDDESSKPVDTVSISLLEQEPVIANNKIICYAGKINCL